MEGLEMVRCVDNLGRLVIPIELRKAMGLSKGDPVQMKVQGKSVIVEKFKDSCMICGSSDDLYTIRDHKKLCSKCMKEIGKIPVD